MFVYPEDIDNRLAWPLGTAKRLARRKWLPHYILPDGSIRFRWEEVEALVERVPASGLTGLEVAHAAS
jgi:hypothetical protein